MSEILNRIVSNIREGSGAAHAYIVEGANSEERAFFTKNFTKALLCSDPSPEMESCGRCPSCIQVEAGTSMDVVHMEMGGKSGYVADDASLFMSRLGMDSYGRYLIGVIDEGDKLSEIVQNKLLKTLEEPTEGTIILIATANADNLLSTVRSRCSRIRLNDSGEEITTVDVEKFRTRFFYKYRDAVDKGISSKDEALALLGELEDLRREAMVSPGQDAEGHAYAIELIETARMDINRGMNYGKALKRLYLELAE